MRPKHLSLCHRCLPALGVMAAWLTLLAGPGWALAQTNAPLTGEMTRPVVRQLPPARAAPAAAQPAATATGAPAASTPVAQAAVAAQSAATAPPVPVARQRIRSAGGASTRTLLATQASGRIAGPERPVLGATATLAWERYVNSFKHPIPEWFEVTVEAGD